MVKPPSHDTLDLLGAATTDLSPDELAEREALEHVTTALALGLTPEPAPAALRSRLLASVARPPQRFAPFVQRLAAMVDVALDRAQAMLEQIADPAAWEFAPKLGPGIALIHLDGGPRVAAADVGFVRVPAGQLFPEHQHHGVERVLILQGSLDDSSGERLTAGDTVVLEPGSQHHFRACAGEPLIYAVTVFGVTFPGIDDPFGND